MKGDKNRGVDTWEQDQQGQRSAEDQQIIDEKGGQATDENTE